MEIKTFEYPRPQNFDANNQEFKIFNTVANISYFEPKINLLKNVRIATNSVVFRYFKIFKESCISEKNYQEYQKGFKFFLKFIFPKFNFSKKTFLLITDEWTSNYYHWHVFALQKLLIMKKAGLLENSLIFLPKKYLSSQFVLSSLEKFGIAKKQIVILRRKSNIKVKKLNIVSNFTAYNPEYLKNLREIIFSKKQSSFGERIYISRKGLDLRFVENEEEILPILKKYGFEVIKFENFSYNQQVEIASNAKFIVSAHGAGLTNILFMQEGSSILELSCKVDESFNGFHYYGLATMIGLKYFYQECKMGQKSKVKDFHHASLIVDCDILEKNIKLMLTNE
jgi:hypothetical protein